jgi:hypothetical protein
MKTSRIFRLAVGQAFEKLPTFPRIPCFQLEQQGRKPGAERIETVKE